MRTSKKKVCVPCCLCHIPEWLTERANRLKHLARLNKSDPEDSATTETPPSDMGEAPSKEIETVWRLAHEGQTLAQSSLATFYLLGPGVPEDAVEAFARLSIAHASGDASVAKNYELVKSRLADEQLEQRQKRAAELQSKISR